MFSIFWSFLYCSVDGFPYGGTFIFWYMNDSNVLRIFLDKNDGVCRLLKRTLTHNFYFGDLESFNNPKGSVYRTSHETEPTDGFSTTTGKRRNNDCLRWMSQPILGLPKFHSHDPLQVLTKEGIYFSFLFSFLFFSPSFFLFYLYSTINIPGERRELKRIKKGSGLHFSYLCFDWNWYMIMFFMLPLLSVTGTERSRMLDLCFYPVRLGSIVYDPVLHPYHVPRYY